jgi:hypothetical protein
MRVFIFLETSIIGPGNESYKLQKQFDGTYRVTVSTELEKLEYKFTREIGRPLKVRKMGKLVLTVRCIAKVTSDWKKFQ